MTSRSPFNGRQNTNGVWEKLGSNSSDGRGRGRWVRERPELPNCVCDVRELPVTQRGTHSKPWKGSDEGKPQSPHHEARQKYPFSVRGIAWRTLGPSVPLSSGRPSPRTGNGRSSSANHHCFLLVRSSAPSSRNAMQDMRWTKQLAATQCDCEKPPLDAANAAS